MTKSEMALWLSVEDQEVVVEALETRLKAFRDTMTEPELENEEYEKISRSAQRLDRIIREITKT